MPYTSFAYFTMLLFVLVPTLAVGFARIGKPFMRWTFAVVGILIPFHYLYPIWIGPHVVPAIGVVIAFIILEWLLLRILISIRAHGIENRIAVYAVFFGLLLPFLSWRVVPVFLPNLSVFVGLAYVTIRVLDIAFNIHDRIIHTLSFLDFLAFTFFFPTISSGPIDRFCRFQSDLHSTRTKEELVSDIDAGIQHLFRGLLYKFVIANMIAHFLMYPAGATPGFAGMLAFMYSFSFFLFFDFAGYSALAIGVGYFFGIRTPENFNMPFIARNIVDFWERWHISLSSWFRDNIYSRFVYTGIKERWPIRHQTLSYIAYAITMGSMALWHGLGASFLVYGLYHTFLLVGYDVIRRCNERNTSSLSETLPTWAITSLSVFVTFNFVCFGLLIFSGYFEPALHL